MGGNLSTQIRAAAEDALAPRSGLYEALLSSPTYLLHVPGSRGEGSRQSLEPADLNLWAEPDTELGGIWIPVFSTPEAAARYAGTLESEEELIWVGQKPGGVYGLLSAIPRLAGARLDPPGQDVPGLEWEEVRALARGRVPPEGPRLYELPDGPYRMPDGLRGRFGHVSPERVGFDGRQVVFPDEAPLALEDFRRWVRLTLDDGEEAWTPCRHFAALLRRQADRDRDFALESVLLAALAAFEMYGDAEALCARLVVEPGRAGFALGELAGIYRRSGRLECALRVCREALCDHPGEAALHRNLALALAEMEDFPAAREAARLGLLRFPADPTLRRLS
ncbi:MAG: hypothetical protein AUJ52_09675 [Elusimicrobia bacterium CG1_02_63_36]|nr:MAG: hypothetical protein AUJ52_09675 [Elusimicrobia bacterium CG1_02_63_36]PIP85115.1 MAG: hypothetical protein COR54_00585 [Elusimicrobia bacterium CG22_combo_CG10-13_8_21_14_all_63_91]PJB24583.1 MAG: hypothetical protein CO113_13115 [Elusimicrobia bacterium CG_4_9_14_3_um_filter_62_55]